MIPRPTLLLRRLLVVSSFLLVAVAPAAAQVTCVSDNQCADGDLCNGIEHCDAGSCVPATAPLVCDDGDPCTTDSCFPSAGCGHADNACPTSCGPGDDGQRCSDDTACTTGDTCSAGVCVGTPLACDDGDPCTADSCHPIFGCVYSEEVNSPVCVSSSQCTFAADHTPCVADGDPCTQDGCLEGACRAGLNQILRQCSDNDACNGEEFCSTVKGCEPGPPPVCDDGASCNGVETCVSPTGCASGTPQGDGTTCDDGQTCTDGDACSAGTCVGAPLACDDANGATSDFCLEGAGCLNCVPLTTTRLNLRFPTPGKPGTFGASGRFVPATAVMPAAAGADLFLHDGTTVVQQSHVAGGAFSNNGSGTVATFVDRSGTVAQGLTRLRVKTGAPGSRHQLTASGAPVDPGFAHQSPRSLTFRTGAVCATATLTCSPTAGGKRDRCR